MINTKTCVQYAKAKNVIFQSLIAVLILEPIASVTCYESFHEDSILP